MHKYELWPDWSTKPILCSEIEAVGIIRGIRGNRRIVNISEGITVYGRRSVDIWISEDADPRYEREIRFLEVG